MYKKEGKNLWVWRLLKAVSIRMKEKNCLKANRFRCLLPKGELVYPMSQHIGAPAKPLVAKGDRVLAGQKIGEAGGIYFCKCNLLRVRYSKGHRAETDGQRRYGSVCDR